MFVVVVAFRDCVGGSFRDGVDGYWPIIELLGQDRPAVEGGGRVNDLDVGGVSRRIVMMGTGSGIDAKAMQTPAVQIQLAKERISKNKHAQHELQKRGRGLGKRCAGARISGGADTRRKGKKRNLHQTRSVWDRRVIKSQQASKRQRVPPPKPVGRACMTDGLTAAAADLRHSQPKLPPSTSGSEQEALRLLFLRPSGQKPSASPAHTAPTRAHQPRHDNWLIGAASSYHTRRIRVLCASWQAVPSLWAPLLLI